MQQRNTGPRTYANIVAPDQSRHLHSLVQELHCPIFNVTRIKNLDSVAFISECVNVKADLEQHCLHMAFNLAL